MIIGIDIRNIGKKRTGDEVVFFNLVKNLAVIDKNNEYKLFTDIEDVGTLGKINEDLGIENNKNFEIISLPTKNKFTWNFWTLPRYIQHNEVDIYITQYIVPFFIPEEVRVATIIHDISFNYFPQFIKKSDLLFLKLLISRSLKRADKILAVSKFTRDEIMKYYKTDENKLAWFYNAVSDDLLAQDTSEEKIKKVKEKYKLPDEYILYIGTMQPRKNLPILIEGYSKLKQDNIKLVLAGGRGHNYDTRINEAIKQYNLEDRVVFPGFIDEEDKAALMRSARVFCFPSLYEGFGIPILEAMSVGTPVIASDIAPHKEITEGAALLFDPQNAEDLVGQSK